MPEEETRGSVARSRAPAQRCPGRATKVPLGTNLPHSHGPQPSRGAASKEMTAIKQPLTKGQRDKGL